MSTQSLFAPISANDIAAVTKLLDSDPMLVHSRSGERDHAYWTPLTLAAAKGHLDLCKLLVERGAEVYTNPMNSYPPIAEANWAGHKSIVDFFLIDIPEKADGTNRLGIAINLAARFGWSDIVRKHIEADPLSVHQRGWIGDSPLHWPSHNDNVEIVAMMLDAGANIEADETNCYGGKPLHWASEHAPATAGLLLERGANPNSRNLKQDSQFFGMTPLIMNATQKDDCWEVTQLLLNAGAAIDAVDANGKTAADHARERGLGGILGVLESRAKA